MPMIMLWQMADRKQKTNNGWQNVRVRKPKAIDDYNNLMNGADLSDQIIGQNTVLRKCARWWKTLFYHMMDMAVVNAFTFFQLYHAEHPDIEELKHPKKFSTTEFREELVRKLCDLD